MWGQICTESAYQTNFNVGFSTYKSDILLHLSQWQYWWWFWFSFLWSFYYFVIVRTIRSRLTKMNPRMNTSLRGRGKWGDFMVSIIPLSWCGNILINSNFILRMIEWQNESSLFTIRVHGKQWYWVYKFEAKDITDIMTAPKNIGNNRWVISTPSELFVTDSYLQSIRTRAQADWVDEYWREIGKKDLQDYNALDFNVTDVKPTKLLSLFSLDNFEVSLEQLTRPFYKDFWIDWSADWSEDDDAIEEIRKKFLEVSDLEVSDLEVSDLEVSDLKISNFSFETIASDVYNSSASLEDYFSEDEDYISGEHLLYPNSYSLDWFSFNEDGNSHYDYLDMDNEWDIEHNIKKKNASGPSRLMKELIVSSNFEKTTNLLKFRFFDENDTLEDKLPANDNFLLMRQKRYKRKQKIKNTRRYDIDPATGKKSIKDEDVKFYARRVLYRNQIFDDSSILDDSSEDDEMDSFTFYKCIRNNRKRSELLPVNLSRRLLRTKKTLVLPAHVNLTIVTNSYDVVHSWFLPGLGIKMDCVPGRSTHHSLYLDNIGFYYGQCAEICGRYHHHMPIRVCALPFEHFLVWWQTKGLPKMLGFTQKKKIVREYANTKFVW